MPINYPQKQDLARFVVHVHVVEGIKVARSDVDDLYKNPRPKELNPFAEGYFNALNYGFRNLLSSPDFPCKEISLVTNLYRSYDAIAWLRELHQKMTGPLAKASLTERWSSEVSITPADCGAYRSYEQALAFNMAPPAHLIPSLLHNWLADTTKFHERVKDKLDTPYGMTASDAGELIRRADEACLFISATQAFPYGNNRLGWLVANLLRLLWRLPWKDIPGYGDSTSHDYKEWIQTLTAFQTSKMPQLIRNAQDTLKEMGG